MTDEQLHTSDETTPEAHDSSEPRFDLDGIITQDTWEEEMRVLPEEVFPQFARYQATLAPNMSVEAFQEFIAFQGDTEDRILKVMRRALLQQWEDTANEEAKSMNARTKRLERDYHDATRRINHWLIGKEVDGLARLDDTNAKRLFGSIPDLEAGLDYEKSMERYVGSEDTEAAINAKKFHVETAVQGRYALDAERKLTIRLPWRRAKTLETPQDLQPFLISKHPWKRRAAHEASFASWEPHVQDYFDFFKLIVKDFGANAELRGYESPIAVQNRKNQVPDNVVTTLLDVIQENVDVPQSFYRWRAKQLGLEVLQPWDHGTPIGGENPRMEYEEARELVLDTYDRLDPEIGRLARNIFEQRHIDPLKRKGKRVGAVTAPMGVGVAPYVLMSYDGYVTGGAFTMFHETFHGVEMQLGQHLPIQAHGTYLPLAETNALFAEMIFADALLERAEATGDDNLGRYVTMRMIANAIRNVFHAGETTLFEIEAHDRIGHDKEGADLESLSEFYLGLKQARFGDTTELDPRQRYDWMATHHVFKLPFYVNAYAFGYLVAMSHAAAFKEDPEGFMPRYKDSLRLGKTKPLDHLLGLAQFDMHDPGSWARGFEPLRALQQKLDSFSTPAPSRVEKVVTAVRNYIKI